MAIFPWKRTEYKTWDEAFRGLAPAVRQQSIRTAAYARAIYVRACSARFGGDDPAVSARMRGQYADVAYKCGMYCQLGKSLVPPEYQILQRDFTPEEQSVYRKYTSDGYNLICKLQSYMMSAKERRRLRPRGYATDNIPWLMVRESAQQHMERWDGTGWPEGRAGSAISPIAQIVGIALELDALSANTKAEKPFDDALDAIRAANGTLWNPDLIEVLNKAEKDCRAVYERYIHYTMTLPETIPLVLKRPERPLGLTFRPMVSKPEGPPVAYEAIPWFRVSAEEELRLESINDYAELLSRTNMVSDVTFYLLYEATDLLYRLKNCEIFHCGVVVEMLPSFFREGSKLREFQQLFDDQPVEKEKLFLTAQEEFVAKANKGVSEIIARYLRNGVRIVLDGWHPDRIARDRLSEMGFHYLRPAPDILGEERTSKAMKDYRLAGFEFIGGNADTEELLRWQLNEGVLFAGGTVTGEAGTEDEVIRIALMKERE